MGFFAFWLPGGFSQQEAPTGNQTVGGERLGYFFLHSLSSHHLSSGSGCFFHKYSSCPEAPVPHLSAFTELPSPFRPRGAIARPWVPHIFLLSPLILPINCPFQMNSPLNSNLGCLPFLMGSLIITTTVNILGLSLHFFKKEMVVNFKAP